MARPPDDAAPDGDASWLDQPNDVFVDDFADRRAGPQPPAEAVDAAGAVWRDAGEAAAVDARFEHPALDRLRQFCLMLPETTEIDGLGRPTFRTGARAFAIFDLLGTGPTVCVKLDLRRQGELIRREGFSREPDTGEHGWTVVVLDGPVDWDEADELVVDSYRRIAPPESVAQLDGLIG